MPFPNEHAARQSPPGNFIRFNRSHPKGFPAGVDAIFGIRDDGKSEIQSLRFDKNKFTVAEAKKWLKDHDFKTSVEAATKPKDTKKVDWIDVLRLDEPIYCQEGHAAYDPKQAAAFIRLKQKLPKKPYG